MSSNAFIISAGTTNDVLTTADSILLQSIEDGIKFDREISDKILNDLISDRSSRTFSNRRLIGCETLFICNNVINYISATGFHRKSICGAIGNRANSLITLLEDENLKEMGGEELVNLANGLWQRVYNEDCNTESIQLN